MPSDELRAFSHAHEPQPTVPARRLESAPGVRHAERQPVVVLLEFDLDRGGTGMLLDVPERFLEDTKQSETDVIAQYGNGIAQSDPGRYSGALLEHPALGLDRSCQSKVLEYGWMELPRQAIDVGCEALEGRRHAGRSVRSLG